MIHDEQRSMRASWEKKEADGVQESTNLALTSSDAGVSFEGHAFTNEDFVELRHLMEETIEAEIEVETEEYQQKQIEEMLRYEEEKLSAMVEELYLTDENK